jgi:hypothetical protein
MQEMASSERRIPSVESAAIDGQPLSHRELAAKQALSLTDVARWKHDTSMVVERSSGGRQIANLNSSNPKRTTAQSGGMTTAREILHVRTWRST